MTKKIILIVALTVSFASISAKESNLNSGLDIMNIIENTEIMDANSFNKISKLSNNLSLSENIYLYDTYKKNVSAAFFLNLFVGFGAGSYYQDDILGGRVGLFGELLSIGSILMLSANHASRLNKLDSEYSGYYYASSYYTERSKIDNDFNLGMTTTVIFWIGIKVYQYVRPFTHTKSYNKNLRRALKPGRIKVEPAITPTIEKDGKVGMLLGATIKL